jgi:hypothetical protein
LNYSVPIPLEDELAAGMLERFAQLNGISSGKQAIEFLKTNTTSNEEQPPIWLLAEACGIDKNKFISRYSMLPVMYPISSYLGSSRESTQRRSIAYRGFITSPTTFRWCMECSKLDLEERGFSHWRRRHQIVGIDWCIDHRIPLSQSPKTVTAHASVIDNESLNILSVSPEEMNNPALLRLQDILYDWLQKHRPLRLQAWTQVIGERCRSLGLRIGEVGKRKVASDWIREQFPKNWLSKHFPEISAKNPQAYVRKVDGACVDKHVSYPALACAAILAVIYDSAKDALAALNEADNRISEGTQFKLPTDSAVLAFLAGEGLQKACDSAGAKLSDVETHLRRMYLELGTASSMCIFAEAQETIVYGMLVVKSAEHYA